MKDIVTISHQTKTADETINIGQSVGENLKGGEVIELISDLGSGKTTFIKGLVKGAGSQELVSSPSFTICNEYIAKSFTIYHFDFYRLKDPGIIKRELAEVVGNMESVVVIEWPDAVENILPSPRLVINIQLTENGERIINLTTSSQLSYLIN
ncbi:MAG: tRNA (adenosine(37)-N6)-threonylcarbamoyltransferase complex ATPase subunit type 1 TsaE [Candidatus Saccharimonadales bacterium]